MNTNHRYCELFCMHKAYCYHPEKCRIYKSDCHKTVFFRGRYSNEAIYELMADKQATKAEIEYALSSREYIVMS
jgi:hypothetical protein